jgi:prepilin-type N-terminal cleavage/methylation domain-containing protein
MNPQTHNLISRPSRVRGMRGFTLVEIMVTMLLLSVIILGLVAMFNQTRRAFTSSLNQVDVLESGRAAGDMIARDLEQMTPSYAANITNFSVFTSFNYYSPQMTNFTDKWTNVIQELYFLTRNNQQWSALGYRLMASDESVGLGALYRYSANVQYNATNNTLNQLGSFSVPNPTNNFNRIIDGVTYFKVLAYAGNGWGTTYTNGALFRLTNNININYTVGPDSIMNIPGLDYTYNFYSNAIPAYVEVELGVLETRTLERFRSMGPGSAAAQNYLLNHGGQVHIFRQRIPIHSVDPAAFP